MLTLLFRIWLIGAVVVFVLYIVVYLLTCYKFWCRRFVEGDKVKKDIFFRTTPMEYEVRKGKRYLNDLPFTWGIWDYGWRIAVLSLLWVFPAVVYTGLFFAPLDEKKKPKISPP